MKLTVNNQLVKIINSAVDVVLEVDEDSDILLNGINITVKGGRLRINQGINYGACFTIYHEGVTFCPMESGSCFSLTCEQQMNPGLGGLPGIIWDQSNYRTFSCMVGAPSSENNIIIHGDENA